MLIVASSRLLMDTHLPSTVRETWMALTALFSSTQGLAQSHHNPRGIPPCVTNDGLKEKTRGSRG